MDVSIIYREYGACGKHIVSATVTDDGEIVEQSREEMGRHIYSYACFTDGIPAETPTEKQTETLAKIWCERAIDNPKIFLGMHVCCWAFNGMNANEVMNKYGSGGKVYLA